MSFWDLLRPPAGTKANASPKPATAAELRDALAEAELAATKAEQDAAAVAQERAELLLEADDKRLDAVERRLQLAQREADRGAAAVAALQERVREAEERERREGLDRLYEEGEAALRAGVEAYASTAASRARWSPICSRCGVGTIRSGASSTTSRKRAIHAGYPTSTTRCARKRPSCGYTSTPCGRRFGWPIPRTP